MLYVGQTVSLIAKMDTKLLILLGKVCMIMNGYSWLSETVAHMVVSETRQKAAQWPPSVH